MQKQDFYLLAKKIIVGLIIFLVPFLVFYSILLFISNQQ